MPALSGHGCPGRQARDLNIPAGQHANIRALRQRNGWTQARLGELWAGPPPPPSAPSKATEVTEVTGPAEPHPAPSAPPRPLCPARHGPSMRGEPVSTRVDGATVQVTVTAHVMLRAGPVHLSLSAREGPAPGTWRYNLNDGTDNRAATGRVAGLADHMAVLRYAAGISAAGYQPGTAERGLLEQFAAARNDEASHPRQ